MTALPETIMAPVVLTLTNPKGGLILEMDFVAEIQVDDNVGPFIVNYYTDDSKQTHLGIHNYKLIEDQDVIEFLSSKEHLLSDQIETAVHEAIWEAA